MTLSKNIVEKTEILEAFMADDNLVTLPIQLNAGRTLSLRPHCDAPKAMSTMTRVITTTLGFFL